MRNKGIYSVVRQYEKIFFFTFKDQLQLNMLPWLMWNQSSLQKRIIKIIMKKKNRYGRIKELEKIIEDSSERIIQECDINHLMQISAQCENYSFYTFLLKSKPRLVKVQHFETFVKQDIRYQNFDIKPDESSVPYGLMTLVVSNIRDLEKSKDGREIIKRLFNLEPLNQVFLNSLEKVLNYKINRENLETFLTYDYRTIIKSAFPNRDVIVSAFGNRDPDVQEFLKTVKIDVNNARGHGHYTALHFAVESVVIQNIQTLLADGADPNIKDTYWLTPLEWILHRGHGFRNFSNEGDECIKLLLIGGSDIFSMYEGDFKVNAIIDYRNFFWVRKDDLCGRDRGLYVKILNLLVAQLAIHKTTGRSVEKPLERYMKLKCENYDCSFYEECLGQLEQLKSHKFREQSCRHKFTMYAIIVESYEIITRYIDERDRCKIMKFMDKYEREKSLLPFYREILENRMEIINRIFEFTCELKIVVAECVGLFDANHLVVNEIVNYLTCEDIAMSQKKCIGR